MVESSSQIENDQYQKEVFDYISRSLYSSKKHFDIWLKCIQKFETPKSIDFLIYLMMMTVNDERTKYLENIVTFFVFNKNFQGQHLSIIFVFFRFGERLKVNNTL